MRIAILQVLDHDSQTRVDCGVVEFVPEVGRHKAMVIEEAAVKVANDKVLYLSSAYDCGNKNISVFVKEGETHVFTAMFHWHNVAPYFAFRLTDGTFTEFYFEKSE
jgi:hypothetical protein